jgi:hypothetical protein
MIKRDNLSCLPTIRYRYNKGPEFMQERHDDRQSIYCNNWDCRDQSGEPEHELEPLRTEHFAFGLFLTSKDISAIATPIFFGKTHFIFEDCFDLCMFLTKAGTQTRHVKSLTFNCRMGRESHHERVKARNGPWRLRSGGCRNPTALASLQFLSEVCPELAYVEMISRSQDWYAPGGQRGPCSSRQEVQILCNMKLQGFSYLPFNEQRRKNTALMIVARGWPPLPPHLSTELCPALHKKRQAEEAVEAHIKRGIEERTAKERSR